MNLPPTVIGTAQLACKILEKIRPAMAAGRTSISDLENQVCCLINYLHMVKHNISFKSAIFSKTNSENTNKTIFLPPILDSAFYYIPKK